LKRVFAIDIEKSAECGGELRVIACIEDPQLIVKILAQTKSEAKTSQQRVQHWMSLSP
jgi:hypothetical protein